MTSEATTTPLPISREKYRNRPSWLIPFFHAVWIATVASNLGTWMQDIGKSWLMTSFALMTRKSCDSILKSPMHV